jgi:hypothetical protein
MFQVSVHVVQMSGTMAFHVFILRESARLLTAGFRAWHHLITAANPIALSNLKIGLRHRGKSPCLPQATRPCGADRKGEALLAPLAPRAKFR